MSLYKILVADDSLTIQKVVKIILDEKHFEITEATDTSSLISEVKNQHFDLILLDFNLSEEDSGYALVQKIKKIRSQSKIIIMYGVFDVVDEKSLIESAIEGKIIKPFDSETLKTICTHTLESESNVISSDNNNDNNNNNNNDNNNDNKISNTSKISNNESLDQKNKNDYEDINWTVHNTTANANANLTATISEKKSIKKINSHDWDVVVPPLLVDDINNESKDDLATIEIPPKINEIEKEQATLPAYEDLEYPDIMNTTSDATISAISTVNNIETSTATNLNPLNPIDQNIVEKKQNTSISYDNINKENIFELGAISKNIINAETEDKIKPKSKLIPIEELILNDLDNSINDSNEENEFEFSGPVSANAKSKTLLNLEDKIKDELSSDDFWSNDDVIIEEKNKPNDDDDDDDEKDDDFLAEDYFKEESGLNIISPVNTSKNETSFELQNHINHEDFIENSINDFKDVFGNEDNNSTISVVKLSEKVEMVAEQNKKHNLSNNFLEENEKKEEKKAVKEEKNEEKIYKKEKIEINYDEIKKHILNELKKDIDIKIETYLNESIKKHCQLIIEKVAWDVIPNAAENLIKSELQRLSQKK
ncbi:MAG: response regulator [Oligoflexia bacterium]|nr:response regulator [Oligoflexia bacterium]